MVAVSLKKEIFFKQKTAYEISIAVTGVQTCALPICYRVKINTAVLNVRKGPGTNYPVTTQVKQGEVYKIGRASCRERV